MLGYYLNKTVNMRRDCSLMIELGMQLKFSFVSFGEDVTHHSTPNMAPDAKTLQLFTVFTGRELEKDFKVWSGSHTRVREQHDLLRNNCLLTFVQLVSHEVSKTSSSKVQK